MRRLRDVARIDLKPGFADSLNQCGGRGGFPTCHIREGKVAHCALKAHMGSYAMGLWFDATGNAMRHPGSGWKKQYF
jgi:hypothetical protein